uniref:Uncharacterized protein n=1 Tax=Oryza sativa subsp. japonica TaxID=39947 RepID=Q5VQ45_ORYSJ|nr:hypothetical protein [Oryza sativa Japonica Group]
MGSNANQIQLGEWWGDEDDGRASMKMTTTTMERWEDTADVRELLEQEGCSSKVDPSCTIPSIKLIVPIFIASSLAGEK